MDGFWDGGKSRLGDAIKKHYAAKVNELQQQCEQCTNDATQKQLGERLKALRNQYRQEMNDADGAIH